MIAVATPVQVVESHAAAGPIAVAVPVIPVIMTSSAIATALSAATRPAQEGEQQQQPAKEEQQWQRPFSSDEKGRPACEERPQIPADAEDQTAGRRADARAHSER